MQYVEGLCSALNYTPPSPQNGSAAVPRHLRRADSELHHGPIGRGRVECLHTGKFQDHRPRLLHCGVYADISYIRPRAYHVDPLFFLDTQRGSHYGLTVLVLFRRFFHTYLCACVSTGWYLVYLGVIPYKHTCVCAHEPVGMQCLCSEAFSDECLKSPSLALKRTLNADD